MRALSILVAIFSVAADFKDVDPNVFPKDDPRAKDMPKMVWNDVHKRMQDANLRESKAFAEVKTKEQWEAYRDVRIKALRESLGTFPDVPKDMKIVVTKKLEGDGYQIHNVVYETRPGLWVSANLYLPAKPVDKMPGLIISHAHHTPKGQGELQDMGMTWARTGCAVLVPDHLGHGERRQHDFKTKDDYPKEFAVSRQDYYFRYNSNLQLSAIGDSLMGWMVWDLMRGIDVLLKQPGIDKDRIIMLGAVAGGGDPAGVTAALDPRIACVVPFNFGGWQPESSVVENPDRDFAWFGEGYWESTRGLRGGAAGGFAHYVIVGSIAPRRIIYSHEFAWDPKIDPAWPRLQKIYGFYDAKDHIGFAHGAGSVKNSGAGNTHCTHIGAAHRKMIYPYLKEWFGMPVPEEYSQRRKPEELLCWTEEAVKELKPKKLHEILKEHTVAGTREWFSGPEPSKIMGLGACIELIIKRAKWARVLGDIEPPINPRITESKTEAVPGGNMIRVVMEPEPGINVPYLFITPKNGAKEKLGVVVMVGQSGKGAFLTQRGELIAAFLKEGLAVCLVDVRGTGETQPGNGSPGRTSTRTSVSQANLILGQTVLGSQLRDLRAVIHWLQGRQEIDGKRIAVWGDPLVKPNGLKAPTFEAPLDAPQLPRYAEPGGALLAIFATLYETGVHDGYAIGGCGLGLLERKDFWKHSYLYLPHDAVIPLMQNHLPQPFVTSTTLINEVSIWNTRSLLSLPWHRAKDFNDLDFESSFDEKPDVIAKTVVKNFQLPDRSKQ